MDEIELCWIVRESCGLPGSTAVAQWTDHVGWSVTLTSGESRWVIVLEHPDPGYCEVQAAVERAVYGSTVWDIVL